jgi:hypothetical protein
LDRDLALPTALELELSTMLVSAQHLLQPYTVGMQSG